MEEDWSSRQYYFLNPSVLHKPCCLGKGFFVTPYTTALERAYILGFFSRNITFKKTIYTIGVTKNRLLIQDVFLVGHPA
jgi:hypothetical protein